MPISNSDSSLSPEPEGLSPLGSPRHSSGPAPRPPVRVQDPFLTKHLSRYKAYAQLDPSRLRMSPADFETWLTSEHDPFLEASSREAADLPLDSDIRRSLFDQPENSYGFVPFVAGNQRVPVPSHPSLVGDVAVIYQLFRVAKPASEDSRSMHLDDDEQVSKDKEVTARARETMASGGYVIAKTAFKPHHHSEDVQMKKGNTVWEHFYCKDRDVQALDTTYRDDLRRTKEHRLVIADMVEELQSMIAPPPKGNAAASRSAAAASTSAGTSDAEALPANLDRTPRAPAYERRFSDLSEEDVVAKLDLYHGLREKLDVSEANASEIQDLATALGDPSAKDSHLISMHQHMSMHTFTELLGDPCSFYNVLSYSNHGRSDTPDSVSVLSDDYYALICGLFVKSFQEDFLHYYTWNLMTSRFTLTLIHQDSSGFATYIEQIRGRKFWFYLQWTVQKPTKKDWLRRAICIGHNDCIGIEYSCQPPWRVGTIHDFSVDWEVYRKRRDDWEQYRVAQWYVVEVVPGMRMLQPSNVPHVVYNVTPGFARGGHFLSTESLPSALVARRLETLHARCFPQQMITNDHHVEMDLILALIIIRLFRWDQIEDADAEIIGPRYLSEINREAALSLILLYKYSNVRYRQPDLPKGAAASLKPSLKKIVDKAITRLSVHFKINPDAIPDEARLKKGNKKNGPQAPIVRTRKRKAADDGNVKSSGANAKRRRATNGNVDEVAGKGKDGGAHGDHRDNAEMSQDDEDDEKIMDRVLSKLNEEPDALLDLDMCELLQRCSTATPDGR